MEFHKNVDIEQLQPMSSYRTVESKKRTSCTFAPWERATEGDRASIASHGVMATRNSLLVTRLTYQIERDLLLTCNLLQTLLQKIDSSEEAVRDEAVRQVVEMINEALKVFSRSTSLSATGLYRAFAKGKSWLVIEGSTLDKHLLSALHRMVKKTGDVKGLFVHVDPGRSGPARLLIKFPMSKIKMANYKVAEVLAPLFVREPYPLSVETKVETKDHHFVVEFGILAGALVTATDATWPDWKAATATAAATQAQLRSLVPIGELSSFMIKTTVAGPVFELLPPSTHRYLHLESVSLSTTTMTATTTSTMLEGEGEGTARSSQMGGVRTLRLSRTRWTLPLYPSRWPFRTGEGAERGGKGQGA